jgi:hypothetical protein
MAPLRSCVVEHGIAGVGRVDGSHGATGGEFRNETCDGRNYVTSVAPPSRRDSSSFCPAITLRSISVEGRVSAFKTFDIYASAC